MSIVVTKRPDARKLHKRLAEGGKLRIYRLIRGETRCVICATAIVDPADRKIHLSENPSLKRRMSNPEITNGTPMSVQWWLQDDKGQLIGPCGAACGPKAVMNAWLKERREEIRQQLLAAGVPAQEVEDRLEQIAHQEWLNMLRVYRAAEKEAAKLKIDTTSMTVDEIVAAVKRVKAQNRFKREVDYAKSQGVPVVELSQGADVGGVHCLTSDEVSSAVTAWKDKIYQAKCNAAKQQRLVNRQKYPEHVKFIEWFLETTDFGKTNRNSPLYYDKRNIEDGLLYIDKGNPFPNTLKTIEEIAGRAKIWPEPWTGNLGIVPAPAPVPVPTSSAPQNGLPKCPICGAELKRRTGTSRFNKPYDFYGCTKFPKCKGTLSVSEWQNQWSRLGTGVAVLVNSPQPQVTVAASKAVAAAQAQVAPYTGPWPPKTPTVEEEEEEQKPKMKRKGYWS